MEKAGRRIFVQYGAGNIGRGFIGQLFSEAGYDVVFIDVDTAVVDALNRDHRYPVQIVAREGNTETWVEPVSAVDGRNLEAVISAIASADIMATAVGANILPRIAIPLAKGLQRRWESGATRPLDILICENLMDANHYLADLVRHELPEELHELFSERVGLVEASIGRMVPVMTPEQKAGNPLRVCVEAYKTLPVDKEAFRGPVPPLETIEPSAPFRFHLERKLYLHNMGHAMTAYLGYLNGFTFIYEAISKPDIRLFVLSAMNDAARSLAMRHGKPLEPLLAHVEDLIYRFGNPALGDTIFRVGRDPVRKLAAEDRLEGAARLCLSQGIFPSWLSTGMAAAFLFNPDGDASALGLASELEKQGMEAVMWSHCGISADEPLGRLVVECYGLLKKGTSLEDMIGLAEEKKRTRR
jgi:mannitol-1-phosphate 5-dehydrogenase